MRPVVNPCDPPVVSEAVVLSGVMAATHGAFRIAAAHADLIGVFDLSTNTLDWVPLEQLPQLFTMAAHYYRPDAMFCAEDFADLRDLKHLTHTHTMDDPDHWALPVFVAPPRLHECQRTAIICVAQWNSTAKFPSTNLRFFSPPPPPPSSPSQ